MLYCPTADAPSDFGHGCIMSLNYSCNIDVSCWKPVCWGVNGNAFTPFVANGIELNKDLISTVNSC